MATWAELLDNIRIDLKDTGETPRWPDDTLYLYGKDAIRDYSTYVPLRKYREELTASNGYFTLPDDFLREETLEKPLGTYLEAALERPGVKIATTYSVSTYRIIGGKIYLDVAPADGETIYLTYKAIHVLPSDADDDETAMTFDAIDEELIRLFVCAKAIEQLRTKQSALDRFKVGSGNRQDNPLLPERNQLMDEYRLRMTEKSGGVIILYRPGRIK